MKDNQGNMDRKTLTDYFIEGKKREGEEFKKNNPNFVESFDALNHTATAMSMAPDFMFNPERFNDKKSIDDLNRRIYDNMEIVGSSFSNDPLINSPSLYNYLGYIENEVESSNASKKLKLAAGVDLVRLKEIVNEVKKGELEDVPDRLKKKDIRDLLDAQILGMKDFMKEIGVNRPNDEKLYPSIENKTIESIFSKESKTSEKETIKEERINTKSEVTKINEVSPLPTPTPEIVPGTNPIKTEEPATYLSTTYDLNLAFDEPEDSLTTSKSGAKIVSDKPTPVSNVSNVSNVTNLNRSELAKTVNENRPSTTDNTNITNNSVASNITKTSPITESSVVIKSESPKELVKKESTSSTSPDIVKDLESMLTPNTEESAMDGIMKGLESMLTGEVSVATPSPIVTKMSGGIKAEAPKPIIKTESVSTPKEFASVKRSEGPKISATVKAPESKKEDTTDENKNLSTEDKEQMTETSFSESTQPEKGTTQSGGSMQEDGSNKDLKESLNRMEYLMAELVRIMKGPILTIDGKVNYS